MGRGKKIEKPEDLYREPFSIVIKLFLSIKNTPLKFNELRFILLEKHGLKNLEKFPKKKLELENKQINLSPKPVSIKHLKLKTKKLMNTTGPNIEKTMTVNGLNSLLNEMKKNKILQHIDGEYSLSGIYFNLFYYHNIMDKIATCSVNETCVTTSGLMCFNMNMRKIGIPGEDEKDEQAIRKIDKLLFQLSNELNYYWVKERLEQFYQELRVLKHKKKKEGELSIEFYAYCIEMANWLIKNSNKRAEDFEDQIAKVKNLAGKGKLDECPYPTNILKIKEKLKKELVTVLVIDSSGDNTKEIIERPLLDAISIISWIESIPVTKVIQKLVRDKQLSDKDGKVLINEQELSNLYQELGLNEIIGPNILDRTPVIVYDAY